MQFKTVLATLAIAASMASAAPFDDLTEIFYARNGSLKCPKYNYQLVCKTTHHCVNGVVTHIPGTYAGNSFCEDHRTCHCE